MGMARVMIVENTEKPLWSAKKLLYSINFEIAFETANGYEAIEKYDLIKPDFVISDLTLSKNDGFSVLEEIKKINNEAKIIIMTSLNDQNRLKECLELGAYAVLRIPFKLKEFLTLVTCNDLTYETKSAIAPVIIDDKS